jgi:site-specific DNA-methyltransferase (adenine-specific)
MKLYSENNNYKLYHGSMLDMLQVIEPNTIDSIVTDPPYELNFMGKGWDNSGIAFQATTWKNCYEVLKPGGYLLAFGGSRTFHRIACAIEDAGFEIRDTIMWLYGSGFPKSMNIGLAIDKKNGIDNRTGKMAKGTGTKGNIYNKALEGQELLPEYEERIAQNEWKGWGTCLKPSFEPIIVARKPFNGSLIENVLEYGVGGLNVDECRVPYGNETDKRIGTDAVNTSKCGFWSKDKNNGETQMYKDDGRFPANTILTYDETDFDEVCGGFPDTKNITKTHTAKNSDTNVNFNFSKK